MSGLTRVLGAVLFGLVFCAGAGASGNDDHYRQGQTPFLRDGTGCDEGDDAHWCFAYEHEECFGEECSGRHMAQRRRPRSWCTGMEPVRSLQSKRTRYRERFSASSYADNLTLGDVVEGEDPVVRAAAIEALGNMNGTAIAIDPSTGRILAMVNQKLALSRGAEPCSTIKLTVALAALEEGIVRRDTPVNLGGQISPDHDGGAGALEQSLF